MCNSGEFGSGVGKGGGTGGSIRDAGGTFGKKEWFEEEKYFRDLQAKQFEELKHQRKMLKMELERQINDHQQTIERHRAELNRLEEMENSSSDEDKN